jgi:hypothetical protein
MKTTFNDLDIKAERNSRLFRLLILFLVLFVIALTILYFLVFRRSDSDSTSDTSNPVKSSLSDIIRGDTVTFGTWQGEPITWRVLARKSDKALLITENSLFIYPYDWGYMPNPYDSSYVRKVADNLAEISEYSITWESCYLRKYLNDEFYTEAFLDDEKAIILTTKLKTPDNRTYEIDGGEDTLDRLFCLSYDEVTKYLPEETDRQANFILTPYEEEKRRLDLDTKYDDEDFIEETLKNNKKVFGDADGFILEWWLRTPGEKESQTMIVTRHGRISEEGYHYKADFVGVRPAMWVEVE